MAKNTTNLFSKIILFLILFFAPFIVHGATLSISPSSGVFEVGNKMSLKIIANSNTPLNAISGVLSIPSNFSIESVSKSGSILNFWVTEPVKIGNTVKFEGVALGGFSGSSGTVVIVNLKANTSGPASFAFQSGQILANDGEGTDITGNLIGATLSINESTAPVPSLPVTPTLPKNKEKEIPVPSIEAPQMSPTLNAPEIMLGSKFGSDSIVGKGEYNKSQVLVTFISEDGVKIFILGNSDENGDFNILVPHSLKHGTYTVTAVIVKEDKTNSTLSNPIIINVGSILEEIGWPVRILILALVLCIIYLILRLHFHFKNKRELGGVSKRELNKVGSTVHKSFEILLEDVEEYDEDLAKDDHRKILEIKKDISEAEKVISKEIEEVENK